MCAISAASHFCPAPLHLNPFWEIRDGKHCSRISYINPRAVPASTKVVLHLPNNVGAQIFKVQNVLIAESNATVEPEMTLSKVVHFKFGYISSTHV